MSEKTFSAEKKPIRIFLLLSFIIIIFMRLEKMEKLGKKNDFNVVWFFILFLLLVISFVLENH